MIHQHTWTLFEAVDFFQTRGVDDGVIVSLLAYLLEKSGILVDWEDDIDVSDALSW